MNNLISKLSIIIVIGAIIGMQSCTQDESVLENNDTLSELKSATMNTFYSKTVSVGNGVARAWIKTSKMGDPIEVGIYLSGKALMNLPNEPVQYVLPLPKNKGNHFYNHVLFDWNPGGHEPPGVYDIPHFDFHFYIIPIEDREAIPPMDPPYMDPAPGAQFIPPLYMQLPGLVPAMGAHWVDVTSPELQPPPNNKTFTKTFILGSFTGEFIFWEPMITRDYLLTQPDEVIPIPQPQAYQKDGWYAMDYKISYTTHPDTYTIALINLEYKQAQ